MSTLETNAIGKYSGNNVSVDDSLNLKSYTTTQRNALTSVAGDIMTTLLLLVVEVEEEFTLVVVEELVDIEIHLTLKHLEVEQVLKQI